MVHPPSGQETTINFPKVSICIPTYNGARFIAQAIESALAQTFTNFELIAVDDGSTDETVGIIERYARRDSRIRVHRNTRNLGLPRNWDSCRDLASGEWIKFLFQDDLFHPECLERMVGAAIEHGAALVCCRRNFIFSPEISETTQKDFIAYTDCHNFARHFPGAQFVPAREFCVQLAATPTGNFIGEPTAVLLHRSAVEAFGRFHPAMAQLVDFEYWARIAVERGIAYVEDPLVTFRVHGNSVTQKNAQAAVRRDKFDGVVMIHDFLHAPAYTNLRSSMKNRARLLRIYALYAARLKQDMAWQAALNHYSELQHGGAITQHAEAITRMADLAHSLWRGRRLFSLGRVNQ